MPTQIEIERCEISLMAPISLRMFKNPPICCRGKERTEQIVSFGQHSQGIERDGEASDQKIRVGEEGFVQ